MNDLELLILSPLSPKCWHCQYKTPLLVYVVLEFGSKVLCMLGEPTEPHPSHIPRTKLVNLWWQFWLMTWAAAPGTQGGAPPPPGTNAELRRSDVGRLEWGCR